MLKYEDWQLPQFEKSLAEARKCREVVANPPKGISNFLKESIITNAEERFQELMDKKTCFYNDLKNLVLNPRLMFLKSPGNIIVCYWGDISEDPHCPGIITMTCQCFRDFKLCKYERLLSPRWCMKITKKEFIHSLMEGEGFQYDIL